MKASVFFLRERKALFHPQDHKEQVDLMHDGDRETGRGCHTIFEHVSYFLSASERAMSVFEGYQQAWRGLSSCSFRDAPEKRSLRLQEIITSQNDF